MRFCRNEYVRLPDLSLKPQLFCDGVIPLFVLPLEILQMSMTIGNHLEEAAPRMHVLSVFLEVGRKLINPLREKRYLNLGRAGILAVDPVFFDNILFFLCGKHDIAIQSQISKICKK